jgi:uncharacterized protein YaaR (DUF327 family)
MQNKKTYTDFIINELNKGNVKYNDVCSVFCSKFQLSERSFNKYWKQANTIHSEQRETINNAKLTTTIEEEKEAVKIGLKSKFERLLILQNEVDNCKKDLENGFTEELKSDGQLLSRPITIQEKTALRNTIKNLQSEISKIEGDYAPTKAENINTNIDKTPIFGDLDLDE